MLDASIAIRCVIATLRSAARNPLVPRGHYLERVLEMQASVEVELAIGTLTY